MVTGLRLVEPTDAHRALVRAAAPLAADRSIRCGPFSVPAAACAVPGRAELESSASSEALRRFLERNPWEGMGMVTKHDWLLLADDEHTLVFGQRCGPVGIGAVVVMEGRDGRFEPTGLAGWSLQFADPRHSAGVAHSAGARGATVTVSWDCGAVGAPDARRAANVIVRIEVYETITEAHFLLVCEPNPALPPLEPRAKRGGVGRRATTTIGLREPLGDRILLNDFRVPAQIVSVEGR